jgi:hypothetical protein
MAVSPNESEVATCFAVQLQESAEPIDVANLPALPIFEHFALYETETMHEGHALHALRLGFFVDATAAEHVVRYVRRSFAAASVVAVDEIERMEACDTDSALREDSEDSDEIIANDSDEAVGRTLPEEQLAHSP